MHGTSNSKLILTGAALCLGGGLVTWGVSQQYIEPVFMFGVFGGVAPFVWAWIIGSIERLQRGPITIPSMPSAPASDPQGPRIPVPQSKPTLRRSLRNLSSASERRQVHTRLPY